MKGTIQKWKLVILLDALLFLSNMTFAKDTINQYTEGNPIDTTAVSISDKTNIPDRLYVDSLSLKRHFIHRIGIEARPGYIFPTSSFFRGENLNWKPIFTEGPTKVLAWATTICMRSRNWATRLLSIYFKERVSPVSTNDCR